ncbi:YggS family pyridoxal phosphate-dependent enzyme [Halocella sp. SP3-1]|uniref:YggS family pyridoxal phosphate-dependent enzyme n=1 Tax=Halocella sp. SP3-1 TaxID=2382161 RepID=UPI000F75BB3D|nr:YggS family pyridoxal phosphate-dependent enzyme [Halocella sp. SP3-1]AZO95106.1 YggS family pyridoxal phosphate-dependent enzyme [Halocella sp. SP3-1]
MAVERLATRLTKVKRRINLAVDRSGRKSGEIKLVAVSKNHPIDKIKYLKEQGISNFGENRVQELLDKAAEIDKITWHFIGHLQRNKVKYLMRIQNCQLIHSLDSWRLAKEIDKRARKNECIMPVLVQVNVAEDENKFGFKLEEVEEFLKKAVKLKNLVIKGLMTVVPYADDPELSRPFFRRLTDLKSDLVQKGYDLEELSMGMTNDFEVAIEEGATIVRVGTALFGKRGDYQ